MNYTGAASVTLYDGTVISDPANTQATAEQCAPFQCGLDPTNQDARYWCAYWNLSGSFSCADEVCAPFVSQIPYCQLPVPASPAAAAVAASVPATAPPVTLTPQNITQPLPDITATDQPLPLGIPSCSVWCDLNQAIADNPLVAVAILAGIAFVLWPKERSRG